MKLALDVWYEARQRSEDRRGTDSDSQELHDTVSVLRGGADRLAQATEYEFTERDQMERSETRLSYLAG